MDMVLVVLTCVGGLLLLATVLSGPRTWPAPGDDEWRDEAVR